VVAVLIKQEVLLLFIGGIFILEAVSVILQVGQLQAAQRQTNFQDGAAASSLRGAGLGGIEDYRALLDRRAGVGAVRADHIETAMTRSVSVARASGLRLAGLRRAHRDLGLRRLATGRSPEGRVTDISHRPLRSSQAGRAPSAGRPTTRGTDEN